MGYIGSNSGPDDVVENFAWEDDVDSRTTNARALRRYGNNGNEQESFFCPLLPFVAGGVDGVASDACLSSSSGMIPMELMNQSSGIHYIPL